MKRFNFITLCFLLIAPLMLNGCPSKHANNNASSMPTMPTSPSHFPGDPSSCAQDNDCPPGMLCFSGAICGPSTCNPNDRKSNPCGEDDGSLFCSASEQRPNLGQCIEF